MRRWSFVPAAVLLVSAAVAQAPDYEGLIALRTSDGFQRALDAAKAESALNPDDGIPYGVIALIYANGGDYLGMGSDAGALKEEALSQALKLAPTAPFTRAAYGLIRMSEDSSNAERSLAQCVDDSPGFLECYNLYGDLLRKTGRTEQAHSVYQSALARWPQDGELRVSLALLLQETGQSQAALELLDDLVQEQPVFARGHWHLATLLYETGGNVSRARAAAKRALDLDPLIWNGTALLRLLEEPNGEKSN
jgi:tetratricopeptide (TPR) repeat protein